MSRPPPERFAWYHRLGAAKQRIYRKSDSILDVPLRDADAIRPFVAPLREALASGERADVQRAGRRLVRALVADLEVPPLRLDILAARPRDGRGELHGLYSWEPPARPLVEVWMRTAVNERVVAWKSFLRTLLHELGHHIDYHRFALGDSLHTRGFYARESSLARQLLPDEAEPPEEAVQLSLF